MSHLTVTIGGYVIAITIAIHRAVQHLKAKKKPAPYYFEMFDSIVPGLMPVDAVAVAGYVGGKWPTYHELSKRFPRAKRLSIAVSIIEDADCLDVESGDASPYQVGGWVKRQKALGKHRPCIYASLALMDAVKAALSAAGVKRWEVRLWVADWTHSPHIPDGFDACQWTNHAMNRNLDESLCHGDFL